MSSLTIQPRFLLSNFSKGRLAKIDVIVVHCTTSTIDSAENWFKNPQSKVSAHYGVGKNGEVRQWVREEDTAWHAGSIVNPTSDLVKARGKTNPNSYSIGIEFENSGDEDFANDQIQVGRGLIDDISKRHGIPKNRKHVIGHREIRANKTCPGKAFRQLTMLLMDNPPEPNTPKNTETELTVKVRYIINKLDAIQASLNQIRPVVQDVRNILS